MRKAVIEYLPEYKFIFIHFWSREGAKGFVFPAERKVTSITVL